MSKTDWSKIVGNVGNTQYVDRINALKSRKLETSAIESTVERTIENLKNKKCRSLVIFGEPQSGKTEMMIALNARLLDEGYPILVNLLTDSVDLLEQSLSRFRESGLSPSPKQYSDLPNDFRRLKRRNWVVFCKKNARDLEKLIENLRHEKSLIVIDDEADYASPDGNINKADYDKTKINQLISDLLGSDGHYIGVTATPARLNLNNTFQNESENWVDFKPHPAYVGQDFFFPRSGQVNFRLHTFNADSGHERKEIEEAVLHFMCGVAELHLEGSKQNFTMLIHTSGKRAEHDEDVGVVKTTLDTLANPSSTGFDKLRRKLFKIAQEYSKGNGDEEATFVLKNIERNTVVKINSSTKKSGKVSDIAKPTSLFSFGIGGNIISRGVTFDNLLSMYFTRGVKGKFSQDTYIQRARMFGSRQSYKNKFQLWIPRNLIENWSKCFTFHKLALDALQSGAAVPVWLADHKTTPTSQASIDRSSVDFESGEMSFGLFDYNEEKIKNLFERNERSDRDVLNSLREAFTDQELPPYVYDYLLSEADRESNIFSFHKPSGFGMDSKTYDQNEIDDIRRKKGIFSTNEYARSEKRNARHHLKVYFNSKGKARIFYKINGGAIRFVQNRR